MPIFHLSNHA